MRITSISTQDSSPFISLGISPLIKVTITCSIPQQKSGLGYNSPPCCLVSELAGSETKQQGGGGRVCACSYVGVVPRMEC